MAFSQYLYVTLAEIYSYADWLCGPFAAIGSKVHQLTLTGFYFLKQD